MDFLLEIAGYLGISSKAGEKIVNAIDWGGTAATVGSVILSVASGGAAAPASVAVDTIILTVKNYIKKSQKAQAVTW
ncbi:uberolysin/carnocyclin family circular bacteriocin [Staphylococcus delphini]|uniref:uberolysin/carnocyclin family circular bacteriocin n=1 Tax=Staphylococcus delphini TaxID=53344 RepID=UPI0021D35C82|nr:uberolysin/carnocyclin family circular bacteriocin [Staphylococcus delphini]UXS21659.1 uberolysin/carnocyclin family circular bacteriocin [Staphylococcus delphini]UXS57603.1 uberolysin/carnocyclin family circular bacteriocin [Staphylococcus delphini]